MVNSPIVTMVIALYAPWGATHHSLSMASLLGFWILACFSLVFFQNMSQTLENRWHNPARNATRNKGNARPVEC